MSTASDIYREVREFTVSAAESFIRRFCPDNRLPGVTAGLRTYPLTDSVLLQLFASLRAIGVDEVAGQSIADRSRPFLSSITDGEGYHTWWSLYVAELLAAEGEPFDSHPWLSDFTDAQKRELLIAMDSTKVVDLDAEQLIGKPNNYWIVMARLEKLRLALGVQKDDRIFQLALAKSREVFIGEPTGFMDDHHESAGRFDMYTFDALHNADPILHLIGGPELDRVLTAHERLLCATAQPNGWYVCWGRSVERMGLMGIEYAAMLLEMGKASRPDVLLGLLAHSFRQFREHHWKDDAVNAHRRGMTHWYRGEGRLLEFSLDVLVGFANATGHLAAVAERQGDLLAAEAPAELFPAQNRWIDFREGGPAVWCYRDAKLDFQLPLVDGYTSDYVAAPLRPGLLEQPVDTGIACGVPNLFYDKKRYLPLRCPRIVERGEDFVTWVTESFTHYERFDWWCPSDDVPGRRTCTLRVEDGQIVGEEVWQFGKVPDALAIFWAETQTRLDVDWRCDQPSQQTTIEVGGMRAWRSYWNPHTSVHQLDIVPAERVRVRYVLRPAT